MIFPDRFRRALGRGALAVMLAALCSAGFSQTAATQTTEDPYQAVLDAMKSPPATGVLITEIGPESAAGAAGARGGDVINSYAGRNITDLLSLRQAVAEVLASRVVEGHTDKVLLGVRRGEKDVVLQIEPAPMGIRAIEVEVGVAAPLNPPASPHGSITLDWDSLPIHTDSDPLYLRTTDSATHTWIGWQARTCTRSDATFAGQHVVTHIEPGQGSDPSTISGNDAIAWRFTAGDFKTSPAFVLESLSVQTADDYETVSTTATRVGAVLRAQQTVAMPERTFAPVSADHPLPLDAVPGPLAPVVAAAIAGEKDAVLPLSLLSVRDFVSRPGYVLAVKPPEKIPESAAPALRVDLMHCGMTVEKYFFDAHHELLRIDLGGGSGVTSVHANSQDAAQLPLHKKESTHLPAAPAGQPALLPQK